MKLGPTERAVLVATQLDADLSLEEIKKRSKVKTTTAHYHLNRLKNEGIIRKVAFTHFPRIGLTQYQMYLELSGTKSRLKFMEFLSTHPRMAWIAQLSGSRHVGLTFCAWNVSEVYSFLEDIEHRFGEVVFSKAFGVIISFTVYPKKYLAPSIAKNEELKFRMGEEVVELDQLDREILSTVASNAAPSMPELARIVKVPRTTLEFRLKRLRERGVILSNIYLINARKLGFLTFKLLVFARGSSSALADELAVFARKHPAVFNFIVCLGAWDFEISAECTRSEEVTLLVEELYHHLGSKIHHIDTLGVFSQSQAPALLSFLNEKNSK